MIEKQGRLEVGECEGVLITAVSREDSRISHDDGFVRAHRIEENQRDEALGTAREHDFFLCRAGDQSADHELLIGEIDVSCGFREILQELGFNMNAILGDNFARIARKRFVCFGEFEERSVGDERILLVGPLWNRELLVTFVVVSVVIIVVVDSKPLQRGYRLQGKKYECKKLFLQGGDRT